MLRHMTSLHRLWFEIGLALCLCGAPAMAAEPGPARQADLRNLVLQDCGSCHGMTLRGGLGSPLLPADLDGIEAVAIADIVLEGIPGTPMPPWRGLLSDSEALWIAHALKTGEFK